MKKIKLSKQMRIVLRTTYKMHLKNYDTLWIIVGYQGFGKSNLMLDILEEWEKITEEQATINSIALTREQFIKAVDQSQPVKGFVAFDEAGDGLLSRDALSEFSKDIIKMYMIIRAKSVFTILVLPSFWYLDKFFRMHQVKALLRVTKRGKFDYFNRRQVLYIAANCENDRDLDNIQPRLKNECFSIYNGHLKAEYEERKKNKINQTLAQMKDKYAEGEKKLTERQALMLDMNRSGLSYYDIADKLGVALGTVSNSFQMIKKKGIEVKDNRLKSEVSIS